RSRPRTKNQQKFAYTGMMQCAECGMSVTATHKTKHMKSGKVHDWTYYHCTKKSRSHKCQQPFVREEELTAQFMDMLGQVALPDDWAIPMLEQIGKWEVEEEDRAEKLRADLADALKKIATKLRRLTDLYL